MFTNQFFHGFGEAKLRLDTTTFYRIEIVLTKYNFAMAC
jgi:hypothetical protein